MRVRFPSKSLERGSGVVLPSPEAILWESTTLAYVLSKRIQAGFATGRGESVVKASD